MNNKTNQKKSIQNFKQVDMNQLQNYLPMNERNGETEDTNKIHIRVHLSKKSNYLYKYSLLTELRIDG